MATGGKKETRSNLLEVGTLTLKTGSKPDDLDPWGVVVVEDKLVITDMKSEKVLVYSRHDGMLLSSSDRLESEPHGVCRVSDTEFCVAMWDASIAVKDSGQISRVKTFQLRPTFYHCLGVALWKDTIVVSGVKDRTTCWCIVSSQDGRPNKLHKVCGGRFSYLTVKHDIVYISCDADSPDDRGVYGFNLLNLRQPPYRYKPEGLTSPCGITVNDTGHLFVCDMYSSIHHLTQKCQLVAIYKDDDIARDPLAIFWDTGVLYMISYERNVITMYETPQQGTTIPAKALTQVDRDDQKKRQLFFGETKALEQDIGSQKGKIFRVKQEAKISPLRSVISVDPVEQVTQRLSKTGIHGSLLGRLSKDLICNDWKFFFRQLSVTEEEIKQIEFDNRHYSLREQIYQLLHFSNKKGILNKRSIIDALQSLDRVDLVTKYKLETFPDS